MPRWGTRNNKNPRLTPCIFVINATPSRPAAGCGSGQWLECSGGVSNPITAARPHPIFTGFRYSSAPSDMRWLSGCVGVLPPPGLWWRDRHRCSGLCPGEMVFGSVVTRPGHAFLRGRTWFAQAGRSPDLRLFVGRRLPVWWLVPAFSPNTVAGTVPDSHRVPFTSSA
jgi:hypothetical protein